MRKKYKIKVTRELLKQLKPFWQELQKIQDSYTLSGHKFGFISLIFRRYLTDLIERFVRRSLVLR